MDISIIVPIYNVEKYLSACLESIEKNVSQLAEIGAEAEIILIDDGSTDTSGDIASAFAAEHPSFQYHRQENSGISAARNFGISLTSGDYLMFVDSDDMLTDGTLARLLTAARETGADMTMCRFVRYDGKRYTNVGMAGEAFNRIDGRITNFDENPLLVFYLMVWNKLYRRDFYEDVGLSFPEGYTYEDNPFSVKAYASARSICALHHTGYIYRIRPTGDAITQQTRAFDSLIDKTEMMDAALQWLAGNGASRAVIDETVAKCCAYDFLSFFNHMLAMPHDEATKFLGIMQTFVSRHLDDVALVRLSPVAQQLMSCVRAGNLDHLLRVVNYRQANYTNTPVIEDEQGFHLMLPRDLFSDASDDALLDFGHSSPSHYVDRIEVDGSCVHIVGHMYRRRFNLAHEGDQEIRAFLYNDRTDIKLPLPTTRSRSESLTEARGRMVNYDDYRTYTYNYDWAGYELDIDLASLAADICLDDLLGDNYSMLHYENRYETGTRDLCGIGTGNRKVLEGATYEVEGYRLGFRVDEREAAILQVEAVPDIEEPTEPAEEDAAHVADAEGSQRSLFGQLLRKR